MFSLKCGAINGGKTLRRPTTHSKPSIITPRHYVTMVSTPRKTKMPPTPAMLDWTTLNYEAYIIGKSIMLFTMFYCSMNWVYYRNLQKKQDDDDKNEKDKEKK